jgi:serine/threonine protein kinase/ActR/RegA family two-component response regulator
VNEAARGQGVGVGTVVGGKYRLVRMIGEGGMGSVWVAHNEALDIQVALKWIRASDEKRTQSHLSERLLQEARATARLDHPAIVRIFDFGTHDGDEPYIVMELLSGEDMASIIARHKQLGSAKAIQSLIPIAGALVVAHRAGVVHRDLKPDNIFMVPLGDDRMQPKLIDFGVAKVTDGRISKVQTSAGALVGSPAYIAPEQASGGEIDHRADIWSFCVVMYECLTGLIPFDGPTPLATVMKVVEADPTPFIHVGLDEPELWEIVARGLKKRPEDRWASMGELRQAMVDWLIARDIHDDISGAPIEMLRAPRGSSPDFWQSAPSQRSKRPTHDSNPRLSRPDGLGSSPRMQRPDGLPGAPTSPGSNPSSTPTPSPHPVEQRVSEVYPRDSHHDEATRMALDITAKPKSQPPVSAVPTRRARVLLADDDGVFRRFVEVALKTNLPHVQLEAVSDGAAAIDAIDRDPPDIALLDLEMPRVGGMEVTASIRAGKYHKPIKVIILTAVGGPTDWKVLFSLGADEFLVKPLRADQLIGTIERMLKELAVR